MDDTCAVCADTLEWVAYGPCGHREVCSTCVARLRFICNDRRCCICKNESNVVFVTKALGDYTRMISDFSLLPSELKEGKVGSYWYHEATEAFFDDLDQYKMVKAMCLLSCTACDNNNMDEQSNNSSGKRAKFRNIEQLKGHLFHWHKLVMCSLCLEGRKVFICEQKVYSRTQLDQHINTGDSEVDGSESDRGGFSGHPMCEFCRNPFYGDNELFTHMSTEHYTCHICQRQNPGQYEYYKNYDDLEIHFGGEHFLCEDVACLAKKFVVFQSESEIKRHNALEHGGRMSRAQRSAALQIPTSFRFKRRDEDHRRGRGRSFFSEPSENQLSMAIQASLEMVNSAGSFQDPSSLSAHLVADRRNVNEGDLIIPPLNSFSTSDSEASSRYLEAMSEPRNHLGESSFPPLPVAPSSSRQKHSGKLPKNTMADHLRRQGKVTAVNSSQASQSLWLVNSQTKKKKNRGTLASGSSTHSLPMTNHAPASSNGSLQNKPAISNGPSTRHTGPTSGWPAISQTHVSTGSPSSSNNPGGYNSIIHSASPPIVVENKSFKSFKSDLSLVSATQIHKPSTNGKPSLIVNAAHNGNKSFNSMSDFPPVSATQIHKPSVGSKPLLNVRDLHTGKKSFNSSISDFPPVSAAVVHKPSTSSKPLLDVKDFHTKNKSLVENMRAALDFDEDKFNNFKEISGQYRSGMINTVEYLASVQQFGLTHLILDLARLCPDSQKQKELIETYNTNMRAIDSLQNGWDNGNLQLKTDSSSSKKGKGKQHVESESISLKSSLADSVMSSVRELQLNFRPSEVEVEELSKDGYRSSRGKSMVTEPPQADLSSQNQLKAKLKGKSAEPGSEHITVDAGGGSKQKKKTSKFLRNRLGDDSAEAYLNGVNNDSDHVADSLNGKGNNSRGLPVRNVWRSVSTQKLFKDIKK